MRTSRTSCRWKASKVRQSSSTPCSFSSVTCTAASSAPCNTRGPWLPPPPSAPCSWRRTRPAPLRSKRNGARWGLGVPLVVLTSPYRSLLRPLLDYLDQIQSRGDEQMVTIVLPEFLPRHWWQHVLHNQTALLVKGALLIRRNTVVADVPYLLKR